MSKFTKEDAILTAKLTVVILTAVLIASFFQPSAPDPMGYKRFLPNKLATPGEFDPAFNLSDVLAFTTVSGVDTIPNDKKDDVKPQYNTATSSVDARYVFDRLVPRELGGTDNTANVWPIRRDAYWGQEEKLAIDRCLLLLVQAGIMPLSEAQLELEEDWIASYQRHIGRRP